MAKHLLIWEEVPETTKAYILDDEIDALIIEKAKKAHGFYVDAGKNDEIDWLREELMNREVDYDSSHSTPIEGGPFVAVYISGFLL